MQDNLLAGGGRRALGDLAVGGGERDQVHPVEFAADVAPGVADRGLDDPDQQQRQPAQLDMGMDPVLAVVVDRAQLERALHVLPAAFHCDQLLAGGGQVIGGESLVVGAQQPLAAQAGFPLDGTVVDALDNALAETTIGLYKTECIRDGSPFRDGPLETLADVEAITSAWVHWYNTCRLMHRLGRRPPAEAEAEYYDHHRAGHPAQAHT